MPEPLEDLQAVARLITSGRREDLDQALVLLEQRSQEDPKTWEYRAHVHQRLGEREAATEDAAKAMALSGRHPYFTAFYADTLFAMGRGEEGFSILQELVRKGSKEPTAYLALTERYLRTGNPADALRAMDAAAESGAEWEHKPLFLVYRSIALILKGNEKQAQKAGLKAFSLLSGRDYRDFSELGRDAMSILSLARLPDDWKHLYYLTVEMWARRSSGQPARIVDIWSTELLNLLPYENEPITPEEEELIREGEESLSRGEVFSLREIERELGLS